MLAVQKLKQTHGWIALILQKVLGFTENIFLRFRLYCSQKNSLDFFHHAASILRLTKRSNFFVVYATIEFILKMCESFLYIV